MGCLREGARWCWPAEGRQCQRRQPWYGLICSARWDGSYCYIEIHVVQLQDKDSPWTSVPPSRRVIQSALVWESPWNGVSLPPDDAMQAMDRLMMMIGWCCFYYSIRNGPEASLEALYAWMFDNCGDIMKTRGIDWRPLLQLWHENINKMLRRVFVFTYV